MTLPGYKLITPPAVELFTVEEGMSFLKVDDEEETPLVASLLKMAREYVELHTGRALIQQTWQAMFDRWPRQQRWTGHHSHNRRISIEKLPLISIDQVSYFDLANVEQTYATDNYTVSTNSQDIFGFLERTLETDWPDLFDKANAISITFKVGYGTTGAAVPETLKHAMKLVMSNFYDQRSAVIAGGVVEVPLNLRHLVESYQVDGYVA